MEFSSLSNRVMAYLHVNYNRKITLSELSTRFNTNRTSLTGQFRKSTGTTIMACLTQIRMQQAALFLRDTALPVGEIVDRVGFVDNAHFWRTFRATIGQSPSGKTQVLACFLKSATLASPSAMPGPSGLPDKTG